MRRAADALRLIAASAVLIPAVLLSAFADARVRRTELAMLESVVTLPATLRDLLTAIAQLVFVLVPLAILVGSVVRRRFALLGRFVVTTVIATAASVLLSQLLRTSHPEEWHGLLSGRGGVFGVTVPPAAWLSGATALLTVANPELSRRWRTALWWTIGTAAALETLRIIQDDNLTQRSRERGEQLLAGLRNRLAGHPLVREVRGCGLLVGIAGSFVGGFLATTLLGRQEQTAGWIGSIIGAIVLLFIYRLIVGRRSVI